MRKRLNLLCFSAARANYQLQNKMFGKSKKKKVPTFKGRP